MSGIEIILAVNVGSTVLGFLVSAIFAKLQNNSLKRSVKDAIGNVLNHKRNENVRQDKASETTAETEPIATPSEAEYLEMKPYYNKKTGKTEYFFQETPRKHT